MLMLFVCILTAMRVYEVYESITSINDPEPPRFQVETFKSPTTGICYEVLNGEFDSYAVSVDCELINER